MACKAQNQRPEACKLAGHSSHSDGSNKLDRCRQCLAACAAFLQKIRNPYVFEKRSSTDERGSRVATASVNNPTPETRQSNTCQNDAKTYIKGSIRCILNKLGQAASLLITVAFYTSSCCS
jgi:hypothetical protein